MKRYSKSERERYLSLYESSDKTQQAFCAEHDINAGTFSWWRKEARRSAENTFIELPRESIVKEEKEFIEIHTSGGTVIKVPA